MKISDIYENENTVIRNNADLHIHSSCSDGSFTPQEIIERVTKFNLKAISITDHDNIDGIKAARLLCDQYGIEFISGVEISARHGKNELHLLGYFFDEENVLLNEYIHFFQEERKKRARKIIDRLNGIGIKIDYDSVIKKAHPGSVGRPHIAHVMVETKYVMNYQDAFNKYLADNRPCFVPKYKISPTDAIKLINQAGGISFIAHPGVDLNNDDILNLIKLGIEGIETIHPRHSPVQIEFYRGIIQRFELLECGGSDCHGYRKDEPLLGKYTIPYQLVLKMKKWLGMKSKEN